MPKALKKLGFIYYEPFTYHRSSYLHKIPYFYGTNISLIFYKKRRALLWLCCSKCSSQAGRTPGPVWGRDERGRSVTIVTTRTTHTTHCSPTVRKMEILRNQKIVWNQKLKSDIYTLVMTSSRSWTQKCDWDTKDSKYK